MKLPHTDNNFSTLSSLSLELLPGTDRSSSVSQNYSLGGLLPWPYSQRSLAENKIHRLAGFLASPRTVCEVRHNSVPFPSLQILDTVILDIMVVQHFRLNIHKEVCKNICNRQVRLPVIDISDVVMSLGTESVCRM